MLKQRLRLWRRLLKQRKNQLRSNFYKVSFVCICCLAGSIVAFGFFFNYQFFDGFMMMCRRKAKATEPKAAKKGKKAKNPNAPKRPPTAFFVFM